MSTRICHLIDANIDTPFFRLLALGCDPNFPVMIGSLAPGGALQEAMLGVGTPTFSLGARFRRDYPLTLLRLISLIRREHVDLLHAHCFDPTFLGLVAARLTGIPFVYTRHHSDHNLRLGKKWHVRIDAFCGRQADHVLAVSAATKRIMTEIEHVPAERISVVYNGMKGLQTPPDHDLDRLRESLGVNHRPICLLVGRLHEEKGHAILFDAIPRIVEQCADVAFLLAGDGPHRAQLEGRAQRDNLASRVQFLGQRSDIAALMSVCTVVVLPSFAESFGFVLVEAMSLGRPVVATTTGGIPEVVDDGKTGILVRPGDVEGFAAAVVSILKSPQLASALGEAGRANWGRFSAEAMMRGYEAAYARVLGS